MRIKTKTPARRFSGLRETETETERDALAHDRFDVGVHVHAHEGYFAGGARVSALHTLLQSARGLRKVVDFQGPPFRPTRLPYSLLEPHSIVRRSTRAQLRIEGLRQARRAKRWSRGIKHLSVSAAGLWPFRAPRPGLRPHNSPHVRAHARQTLGRS